MKFFRRILLLLLCLFCLTRITSAEEPSLGEKLVRELWKDAAEGNLKKIEKSMAPEFQSVHEDITRDAAEEMKLLKDLQLGEYELSDFEITETDSFILVTYRVMTEEKVAGFDLPARATMRLSAWIKTPDGWKWIAHANLNPLRPDTSEPPPENSEQATPSTPPPET